MEQTNNFILLPDIQRSPESEFPNLRVCDFIISELKKLKQQYGDETILVSLFKCYKFIHDQSNYRILYYLD